MSVYKTVLSTAPGKVTDLLIFKRSAKEIQLKWRYPIHPSGNVFAFGIRLISKEFCRHGVIFRCSVCDVGQVPSFNECLKTTLIENKSNWTAPGNHLLLRFYNLQSNKEYTIEVFAINEAGSGDVSKVQATTRESDKPKGSACLFDDECQNTLTCRNLVCDCSTYTQYWDGNQCQRKVDLEGECSSNSQCLDANAHCLSHNNIQKKCLCGADFYENNNVCHQVDELKVKLPSVTSRKTDSIYFFWIASTTGPSVHYRIIHLPSTGSHTASASGGSLRSLTPGTKYQITIQTFIPTTLHYNERLTEYIMTPVWTYPSAPGLFDASKSDFVTSPMTFAFHPATGNAAKYKVLITQGGVTVVSTDVTDIKVTGLTLKRAQTYEYQIIAFNANGDQSSPTFGFFVTVSAGNLVSCSHTSQCPANNEECLSKGDNPKKCLCKVGFYKSHEAGVCRSMNELKIQSASITSRVTNSISFYWTLKVTDPFVLYRIKLTPSTGSQTASTSGGSLTGLTPGTRYQITVQSFIPASFYYNERYTEYGMTPVWTYPSSPGQIDLSKSDLVISPMVFAFTPSSGSVSKYKVLISHRGITVYSTEVPNNLVTGLTLNLGVTYQYQIFAFNGNGDSSAVTSGAFTTIGAAPSKIQDISMISKSAKTAGLRWKPPLNPNGQIYAFVLKVYKHGFCCLSVFWKCQQCLDEQSVQVPSFTDCSESKVSEESFPSPDQVNNANHTMTWLLFNLDSNTDYIVKVFAVNQDGNGVVEEVHFTTEKSDKPKGSPCTFDDECLNTLSCKNSVCDCDIGTQHWDGYQCQSNGVHLDNCSSNSKCMDTNTACLSHNNAPKKCLCKADYYQNENTGVCHPVDDLKIQSLAVIVRRTDSIYFSWIVVATDPSIRYRIIHTPSHGSQTASENGGSLTSLTTGTRYEITTQSYIPASRFYNERYTEYNGTPVWTYPSSPGQFDLNKSDLTNSPMTFAFQPASGNVAKYKVSIMQGGRTVASSHVMESKVTGLTLSAAQTYQYTIIAYNGNGDESKPISGTFKTDFSENYHLDNCSSNSKCLDTNAACLSHNNAPKKCLCKTDYYQNLKTDVCHPVDELKVQSPRVTSRHTDSITFTWTGDVLSSSIGYRIKHTPPTGSQTASAVDGILTDLNPGTKYDISIHSYIPASLYYNERHTETVMTPAWTYPSSPGRIDLNQSALGKTPMTFAFHPAIGNVAKYKVFITQGESTVVSRDVTNNEVTALNLNPAQTYAYRLIAINGNGDQSQETSGIFTTNSQGQSDENSGGSDGTALVFILPAVLCGILLLIITFISVFCLMKKRRGNPPQRQRLRPSENRLSELQDLGTNENRCIKIKNLKQHVATMHGYSNLLFKKQFEDLRTISSKFKHLPRGQGTDGDWNKAQATSSSKNLYLESCYIPGLNSELDYIVTLWPKHDTIPMFWEMVWKHGSKVIVMLLSSMENTNSKPDQYWPEMEHHRTYGEITIEVTNVTKFNRCITREMKMLKGHKIREVTQYVIPDWCGKENISTTNIIQFLRSVRESRPALITGPLLVHCSAGVGRTGTFIALDYFMQYIDRHSLEDDIDIFEYVLQMRKNKENMVENTLQYVFIFDVLVELIQKKKEDDHIYACLSYDRVDNDTGSHQQPQRSRANDETDESGYERAFGIDTPDPEPKRTNSDDEFEFSSSTATNNAQSDYTNMKLDLCQDP